MGFLGRDGLIARNRRAQSVYEPKVSEDDDAEVDDDDDLAPPDPDTSSTEFPEAEAKSSPLADARPDISSVTDELSNVELPDPGPGELPDDGLGQNEEAPEGDTGIESDADPTTPVTAGPATPEDPLAAPGIDADPVAGARRRVAEMLAAQRFGGQ